MSGLLAILSPAKTIEMCDASVVAEPSRARFQTKTRELVEFLASYSPAQLTKLMSISNTLAELNAERWETFGSRSNPRGPAAMCFRGDVYMGLEAWTLPARSLNWLQDHLRILSGLFGPLRPLDVIQPYRLEMGTKLKVDGTSNLYEFWGNDITRTLKRDMASVKADVLVNLASEEYAKSIDFEALGVPVLQTAFLQRSGGASKFVSFFAKRARGLMARWMAEHRPTNADALRDFDLEGYRCDVKASSEEKLVFSRPKPAPRSAARR